MLDVRRLRVLCAVADHSSLSAAAESLSYTPSAVSQQIVALEREVGARLLHRGPKGVRLTAAGRVLVEHARPVLDGLQVAESSLAALTGLHAGQLHLASFATAGATVLPQAIATFRGAHPEIGLTLSQADPEAAMARLRAGEVDLILTADAELTDDRAVVTVPLFDDPLFAVLPAGHPLAAGDAVRLEALASETWADTPARPGAHRLLLLACREAGFIPHIAFESDEYATVLQLVAAGAGVALVPGLALDAPPPGVAVRALERRVARRIVAALHAPAYRAPAAGAMLAILQEVSRGRDYSVR